MLFVYGLLVGIAVGVAGLLLLQKQIAVARNKAAADLVNLSNKIK